MNSGVVDLPEHKAKIDEIEEHFMKAIFITSKTFADSRAANQCPPPSASAREAIREAIIRADQELIRADQELVRLDFFNNRLLYS